MLKKIFMSLLFAIFIFVSLYTNICYAAPVKVTKENLNEAFKKLVSSGEVEEKLDIVVLDDTIKLTVEDESYILKYDLTDEPTFSIEIPIEKGMNYEEFKEKTGNLILPMCGYAAVANVQGTKIEDAISYIMLSYFKTALGSGSLNENPYVIVEGTKEGNDKTIYTSEFGDRVMEYVNATYSETETMSDSDEINSYKFKIEKKDVTETSCKLVSTLSINLDADFSKLSEYSNGIFDNGITKDNAEHVIALKVGQKCKIQGINGYQITGECVEIDNKTNEITAIKKGEASGYFYIGENYQEQKKASFYVTVEENKGNEKLETITLKIDDNKESNKTETDKSETNKDNNKESNTIKNPNTLKENNTADLDVLPKTGVEKNTNLIILYAIIVISSISFITLLGISQKEK